MRPAATDPGTTPALTVGLGWRPELPDARDLELGCADGRDQLAALVQRGLSGGSRSNVLKVRSGEFTPRHLLDDEDTPPRVDVRERLPNKERPISRRWSVESQGVLNSCTAHAVIGLVEYLVRWQLRQALDLSRMFLYAATRRLLGWSGDPGAYIRTTIQAMAVFGVPPEEFWPYEPSLLDASPDAFLFSYAASFKALTYMRLDSNQMSGGGAAVGAGGQARSAAANQPRGTLRLLEQALADGYPVAFGFPVYSCIRDNRPSIPVPSFDDRLLGGHAVLAVGYDRTKFKGEGGVLIRNSWGEQWGNRGYGWLPYAYVTRGLACDFWTIFKQSWLEGERFQ
jgi:C1A family cysteine protease